MNGHYQEHMDELAGGRRSLFGLGDRLVAVIAAHASDRARHRMASTSEQACGTAQHTAALEPNAMQPLLASTSTLRPAFPRCLGQRATKRRVHQANRAVRVHMSATNGFRHQRVDDAELMEVRGSHTERFRDLWCTLAVTEPDTEAVPLIEGA